MEKVVLFGLIAVLSLFLISAFWHLDDFEEHSDSIYISNLHTGFENHSDGWYQYFAEFEVNNLSSKSTIYVVTSFWDENNLVSENLKIEYDKYYLDSDNKRQFAPDAELVFNTNYSSDNYTVNLGNKSINPNLNPISVYSSILIKNFTNVDHVKISIIDVTHDKLLFQTLKPFNITNQYLVDDDINRIVSNSSLIESEFSLDLDVKKNFNNFKKLDSDDNDVITFNEFKNISKIEDYNYFSDYSNNELKSEFNAYDSNKDGFLIIDEFKILL